MRTAGNNVSGRGVIRKVSLRRAPNNLLDQIIRNKTG